MDIETGTATAPTGTTGHMDYPLSKDSGSQIPDSGSPVIYLYPIIIFFLFLIFYIIIIIVVVIIIFISNRLDSINQMLLDFLLAFQCRFSGAIELQRR